jgi:hypothetical protein
VAIGVKTFNPVSTGRSDLLHGTVRSLRQCFDAPIYLLDNGSTDDTLALLSRCSSTTGAVWKRARSTDGNVTPGRGYNLLLEWIGRTETAAHGALPDVVVFSDDDMWWRADAHPFDKLRSIWSAVTAPEGDWSRVAIVSGFLEPEWHWNKPRLTMRPNGVPVLVRDSAPGAAWTFRLTPLRPDGEVPKIGEKLRALIDRDGPPIFADSWGADFRFCEILRREGRMVAQVDLADHRGWGRSTHGNEATGSAVPLDRKKWGV